MFELVCKDGSKIKLYCQRHKQDANVQLNKEGYDSSNTVKIKGQAYKILTGNYLGNSLGILGQS
jgi:hypothetical protein